MQQSNKTILIVDDDWSIREALRDLLADAGYQSAHARDGREALKYLHANAGSVSLILLDMMMPEVDGVQFLLRQQEDPVLTRIPVIMMTGNERLVRAGQFLGIREYIDKPFDINTLLAMVDRMSLKE